MSAMAEGAFKNSSIKVCRSSGWVACRCFRANNQRRTGKEKTGKHSQLGGRVRTIFLLAVGTGLAFSVPATAADFFSTFDPAPMTMATRADVAGTGSVNADLQGNKLTVQGSFSGLASAATKAQLHSGSMTGVPGEAFADLTVTPTAAGTLTGTVTLNRAQQKALLAGAIYVQIDSVKAPDGTLRAWLLRRQP